MKVFIEIFDRTVHVHEVKGMEIINQPPLTLVYQTRQGAKILAGNTSDEGNNTIFFGTSSDLGEFHLGGISETIGHNRVVFLTLDRINEAIAVKDQRTADGKAVMVVLRE